MAIEEAKKCVECGKPLEPRNDGKAHFHCLTGGLLSDFSHHHLTFLDFYAAAYLAGRAARSDFGTPAKCAEEAFSTAFAMLKKRQEIWKAFEEPVRQPEPKNTQNS